MFQCTMPYALVAIAVLMSGCTPAATTPPANTSAPAMTPTAASTATTATTRPVWAMNVGGGAYTSLDGIVYAA